MQFVYLFLSFHVVHIVTSFVSLQLFFPVRLAFPFRSTRPFHCIRPFVATFPFHSLLPFFRFKKRLSRSFASSFRFKPFISFHHSFRFNLYIWCHCRLEKNRSCEWLLFWISTTARFATMLQFLIQALFAFLLETQENMDLMVWGLHNIPFIGNRGRHTSPSPQTHHPADSYLWVSQLAAKLTISIYLLYFKNLGVCSKLLLITRSFWNVVEEGREQTDAYTDATQLMHSIMCALQDLPYLMPSHHALCLPYLVMSLQKHQKLCLGNPILHFRMLHSFVGSGLRERIRLREPFVFGTEFVFGGNFRLRWIRLQNSSSEFIFGK